MKILNLGCGTKTSADPDVINIDWSIYFRLKKNRIAGILAQPFLHGERLQRFNSLPNNIMVHNLERGLPFASDSIDVVYHSHFLEHLDRDAARKFLLEVKRVLKLGGVQRIVVPDLEQAVRGYMKHLATCQDDTEEAGRHDAYVAAIIEQCVRREAYGSSHQKPFLRMMEKVLLGDARRRGETHQWLYDKVNLSILLIRLGYKDPRISRYDESQIPNWRRFGLEENDLGDEYKPGSLYIEAQK